jgi:hypothetical protein
MKDLNSRFSAIFLLTHFLKIHIHLKWLGKKGYQSVSFSGGGFVCMSHKSPDSFLPHCIEELMFHRGSRPVFLSREKRVLLALLLEMQVGAGGGCRQTKMWHVAYTSCHGLDMVVA